MTNILNRKAPYSIWKHAPGILGKEDEWRYPVSPLDNLFGGRARPSTRMADRAVSDPSDSWQIVTAMPVALDHRPGKEFLLDYHADGHVRGGKKGVTVFPGVLWAQFPQWST